MICVVDKCNKEASATISYDVLDVSSTENVWVTTEPVYKKVAIAYCKEHFKNEVKDLHTADLKKDKK